MLLSKGARTSVRLMAGLAALLLSAVTTASAGQAELDAGWQLKATDETRDIEVYQRTRPDRSREFLAITKVRARLSALAAVLQDAQAMPRWVHQVREAQVLESSEPSRALVRMVTEMPWPLHDREAIVDWRMRQDEATGEVRLDGTSVEHALPVAEGLVRMPQVVSAWRLKPQPGGWIEVRFSGYAHMGGKLNYPPLQAFMATAIWQTPLETFKGLHRMLELPAYRSATLPLIREPQ